MGDRVQPNQPEIDYQSMDNNTAQFNVPGMGSYHCAGLISTSLQRLPGVLSVQTNIANHHVDVEYDDSKLTEARIREAIENAGYKPGRKSEGGEVSIALDELAVEHEWDMEETGVYRIYRFPGQQQLQQQQPFATIIVDANVPPLSSPQAVTDYINAHVLRAKQNQTVVVPQQSMVITDQPKRGDWFAFDYSDTGKPEVFITGSPNRIAVRNFYSKEYDSQYREVAANIIK